MTTNAYAVLNGDGVILVDTVGRTRREANVNWLWAEAKIRILEGTTDTKIENLWESWRGGNECVAIYVSVGE